MLAQTRAAKARSVGRRRFGDASLALGNRENDVLVHGSNVPRTSIHRPRKWVATNGCSHNLRGWNLTPRGIGKTSGMQFSQRDHSQPAVHREPLAPIEP